MKYLMVLLPLILSLPALAKQGAVKAGMCVIVYSNDHLVTGACHNPRVTCNSDKTCTIQGYRVKGRVKTGPMPRGRGVKAIR